MIRSARCCVAVVAAAVFAVGRASAQHTTDPREMLRKADAALRNVNDVVYEAESWATGALANDGLRIKGRVALRESKPPRANFCRLDLVLQPTEQGGEPRKMSIACDGQAVMVVDESRKMYGREPLPKGQILIDAVGSILMTEFCSTRPFTDEMSGTDVRLEGEQKIAGEDCAIISVKYADEAGTKARWFISKSDFLPRQVERTMVGQSGETTLHLALSSLDVRPNLDNAIFQLGQPEGFESVSVQRWRDAPARGTASQPASPATRPASGTPADRRP